MRHLSAMILIVFVLVLPSCKYFKSKGLFGRKADTTAVWRARQDSTRVADSLRIVQEQLQTIENERLATARKADKERSEIENNYKYNIIIGSFISSENAKNLSYAYRKHGYNSQVIKMEGSKFELVSIGAYNSMVKAASRLKEFQDSAKIEPWLYIKK